MKEIDIAGVFFSPFALCLVIATAIFLPMRAFVFQRWIEPHVWHPALFELALFVMILAGVCLFA